MYIPTTNKSARPKVSKKMRTGSIGKICLEGRSFDEMEDLEDGGSDFLPRRLVMSDSEDEIENSNSNISSNSSNSDVEEKENISPLMSSLDVSSSPTSAGIKRRHGSIRQEPPPVGTEHHTPSTTSLFFSERDDQGILLPRLGCVPKPPLCASQLQEEGDDGMSSLHFPVPSTHSDTPGTPGSRPATNFGCLGPRPRWAPSPAYDFDHTEDSLFSTNARGTQKPHSPVGSLPAFSLFPEPDDADECKSPIGREPANGSMLSPVALPSSDSASASVTPATTTPKTTGTVRLATPATWYGTLQYQSPHWTGPVSINPFSPVPPEYLLEASFRSDPGSSSVFSSPTKSPSKYQRHRPRAGLHRQRKSYYRHPHSAVKSASLSDGYNFAFHKTANSVRDPDITGGSTFCSSPPLAFSHNSNNTSPTFPHDETTLPLSRDDEGEDRPVPPTPVKSVAARSRFSSFDSVFRDNDIRCGRKHKLAAIRQVASFSPTRPPPSSPSTRRPPAPQRRMGRCRSYDDDSAFFAKDGFHVGNGCDAFSHSENLPQRPDVCSSPPLFSRFHNDFQVLGVLGNGCFGTVYECISRLDGCLYAVKVMNRAARGDLDRGRMLKEVHALAALCNQSDGATFHIVRYHQAWMENNTIHIQMELCTSTLNREMKEERNTTENEVKRFQLLRELLLALEFIHRNQMVHLDIKPENIFLKNGQFKLGDFGLASKVNLDNDFDEGDARYMSKELLSGKCHDATKCDIFSLGATAYEVCLGRPLPASGPEWHSIRSGGVNESSSSLPNTSPELCRIIAEMMHPDPSQRPSASELLQRRELLSPERRQLLEEKEKVREALKLVAAQEEILNGADGRPNSFALVLDRNAKKGTLTKTSSPRTSMLMAAASLSPSKRCLARSNSCSL